MKTMNVRGAYVPIRTRPRHPKPRHNQLTPRFYDRKSSGATPLWPFQLRKPGKSWPKTTTRRVGAPYVWQSVFGQERNSTALLKKSMGSIASSAISHDTGPVLNPPHQIEYISKVRYRSQRISQASREKLGISSLDVLFSHEGRSNSTSTPNIKTLLENFENLCQAQHTSGLLCGTLAVQALSRRFPWATGWLASETPFQRDQEPSTAAKKDGLVFAHFCFASGRVVFPLRLNIKLDRRFKPRFRSANKPGSVSAYAEIKLYARVADSTNISLSSNHDLFSSETEASALCRMCSNVLEKLFEAMVFDTLETVPHVCAEAILRTVDFSSPNLRLRRVGVSMDIPKYMGLELQKINGTASWCDGPDKMPDEHEGGELQKIFTTAKSAVAEPVAFLDELKADKGQIKATKNRRQRPAKIENSNAVGDSDPIETRATDTTLLPRLNPVYLALGSNVGDRVDNIESACQAIDRNKNIRIARTSALYETEPMYVENQNKFLNGACQIMTTLQPIELLDQLQDIEKQLGRVKTIDKGPRNIDLDILMYGNLKLSTERLTIPHPGMLEREFVLRPLCNIQGASLHSSDVRSLHHHLEDLPKSSQPMHSYTPLAPGHRELRATDPKRSTQLMAILNITPDSFSDGGDNDPTEVEDLRSTVRSQIEAGATIIDVGGQSSRPNARDISAEEELARVLPAIEMIKSLPEAADIAISIDTYRSTVAEGAVRAGAHIINDISAGLLDPQMLSTVAKLGCTYIMMHMRGTPATMQSIENCSYPDGLIATVASELHNRVIAAQEAGIRCWRIILDPGLGFAKTTDQNVELLAKFSQLRDAFPVRGFPWLVGTSRKGFIGKITGVDDPKARSWGTAATVTAAIQGGADVVRIHDVQEMSTVVKMADSIFRI